MCDHDTWDNDEVQSNDDEIWSNDEGLNSRTSLTSLLGMDKDIYDILTYSS